MRPRSPAGLAVPSVRGQLAEEEALVPVTNVIGTRTLRGVGSLGPAAAFSPGSWVWGQDSKTGLLGYCDHSL